MYISSTAQIYNKYQIWIEHGGKRDMLPLNPPKISFKIPGNNKTVIIIDKAEAVIPQIPKATEVSFSGFFSNYWLMSEHRRTQKQTRVEAKYFVTLFWELMQKKEVVRLCVTGCGFFLPCVVDSFDFSESGGDVGTYDYSVKFKEYSAPRIYMIDTGKGTGIKSGAGNGNGGTRTDIRKKTELYPVKAGDCLWSIALKVYGDGSRYTEIQKANKPLFDSRGNPLLIYAGDNLIIP